MSKIQNLSKEKGITLVALVITIVILIILAVISMSAIFGDNGLITSAQKARKEQEKAEARERLELVLADAFTEKKVTEKYTEEEFLENHLEEFVYEREKDAEIFNEDGQDLISLNGHVFELDRSVPQLGEWVGEKGNLLPAIRSINVENKTLSEITVKVVTARAEGATLRYSIKKLEEDDLTYTQIEEKAELTNTFEELTSPETYRIKVELIVKGEKVDELTEDVLLGELEEETIKFGDVTWPGNGTASATVTTNTSYQLQYQINAIEDDGWQIISNGGTITNIPAKDANVYARLWDGTNASDYATLPVNDEIDPKITEIKEIEVTETTIKVQVVANDNESGITKIEYSKDDGSSYTTETIATATEYTFEELTESTEYTVKVRVTDGAGNTAELSKKITTNGEKFSEIYDKTTEYTDSEGNTAWIPGGFAVGTSDGINKISGGLVIKDAKGNQFVWIPIGTYNVPTTINSSGKLTNELTRRSWGEANELQEAISVEGDNVIEGNYYGEGNNKSIAYEEIEKFKTSTLTYGGFYIGRYEQGTGNVIKKDVEVFVNVTRNQAKVYAEELYNGSEFVKSELISSYAWDTALNFICQTNTEGYLLATTTSSNYGNIGRNIQHTGMYIQDNYSNIHDMLGNIVEWTTEYHTPTNGSCVFMGGYSDTGSYSARRYYKPTTHSTYNLGFRTQLYITK